MLEKGAGNGLLSGRVSWFKTLHEEAKMGLYVDVKDVVRRVKVIGSAS